MLLDVSEDLCGSSHQHLHLRAPLLPLLVAVTHLQPWQDEHEGEPTIHPRIRLEKKGICTYTFTHDLYCVGSDLGELLERRNAALARGIQDGDGISHTMCMVKMAGWTEMTEASSKSIKSDFVGVGEIT